MAVFVTITLNDGIKCELPIEFLDLQHSYDNGRVTGTIKNYPIIKALDWNQFCNDVNAVRKLAGWWDVGCSVTPGMPMTASLFNDLYRAINDIYVEGFGLPEMPSNDFIQSGYKMDDLESFISQLCKALKGLRDYYQSTRID
jgi:hypothetical protein